MLVGSLAQPRAARLSTRHGSCCPHAVVFRLEGQVSLALPQQRRMTGDQMYDVRQHEQEPGDKHTRINVGRTERLVSMVAGGILAGYATRRRSPLGGAAAIAGALLLHRGATGHCAVYQAAGINRVRGTGISADRGSDTRSRLGGAAGIMVEESVTIRRPLAEVFAFWRKLENLPRFMEHLASVNEHPDGTSHWVAKGPAGMQVEWDARIINELPNNLIAWQSLTGATVATAGSVHFTETRLGTTVRTRFQYDPPAGKVGAAVAALLGDDPAQSVREDLRRLKVVLEQEPAINDPRYSPSPPVG